MRKAGSTNAISQGHIVPAVPGHAETFSASLRIPPRRVSVYATALGGRDFRNTKPATYPAADPAPRPIAPAPAAPSPQTSRTAYSPSASSALIEPITSSLVLRKKISKGFEDPRHRLRPAEVVHHAGEVVAVLLHQLRIFIGAEIGRTHTQLDEALRSPARC